MSDQLRDQSHAASGAASDDPPPMLGRWRNFYLLVLIELVLLIALFAALTWWAS